MAVVQQVTLGDMVRLRFLSWPPRHPKAGRYPLTLTWNNRAFVIREGEDGFVPFDLAKLYFGDPRSLEDVIRIKDDNGNDMIVADRAAEVRRLQQYWQSAAFGTNNVRFREYLPGDRSFIDEGISDLLPNIEVYTLSGERVYMVTDDPYGDHVVAATSTRHEQEAVQQQLREQSDVISELRKQNAMLMKYLDIKPDVLDDILSESPAPRAPYSTYPPASPQPVDKQDSALSTPETASVENRPEGLQQPPMFYNPKTRKVEQRRNPVTNPISISELPEDKD